MKSKLTKQKEAFERAAFAIINGKVLKTEERLNHLEYVLANVYNEITLAERKKYSADLDAAKKSKAKHTRGGSFYGPIYDPKKAARELY